MSTNKIIITLFYCAVLCSCSVAKQEEWFVTHNGNMPTEERIVQIKKGASKDDVLRVLGAPSSIPSFDKNTWLYMSSDIKSVAFMEPKEVNRSILKISFNNKDEVAVITRLTKEDGKNISPSQERTEVKGQDPGFFRKYFGGVGQFNPFAGQANPNL